MAENLLQMDGFVREAADRGADLVCFPELSLTGYSLGRESIDIPSMDLPEAVPLLGPLAES